MLSLKRSASEKKKLQLALEILQSKKHTGI
jgi:hypothetical protein